MSTKLIIYDYEIFKYDSLLGAYIIDADDNLTLYQTWDRKEIEDFYEANKNNVWIGHNNFGYDDHITEAIVTGMNPYVVSKGIIDKTAKVNKYVNIQLHSYDNTNKMNYSLKLSELIVGKNVHETDVDFNLDRHLTEEEKKLEEAYNRDDLEMTLYNFRIFFNQFQLRVDLIKEFKLDFDKVMHSTEAGIAATVLLAKRNPNLINEPYHPKTLKTLRVKDEELLNWYYNEEFREGKVLTRLYGGCEVKIASGGAHGALENVYIRKALYFDVSGYYNLIMILYDMLSRSVSEEGKKRYINMYYEQLKMKKSNPLKRAAYKTILLAVFGAQINEYSDFYDPWKGPLVPVTGEVFLVDLMEKLDGLIKVVQSTIDWAELKQLLPYQGCQ